jgi:hypothetical protein
VIFGAVICSFRGLSVNERGAAMLAAAAARRIEPLLPI